MRRRPLRRTNSFIELKSRRKRSVSQLDIECMTSIYEEHSKNNVADSKGLSREREIAYLQQDQAPLLIDIKVLGKSLPSLNSEEYTAFAIDDKRLTARLPVKSEEVDCIHLTMTTGLELIALCLSPFTN